MGETFAIVEIDTVENATPEEVSERLAVNRPVIFRDAVTSWPAFGNWSPKNFRDRFPETTLRLYDGAHRDTIACTFSEFVTYIDDGKRIGALSETCNDLYLAWNSDVISKHASLQSEFDFQPFFGDRRGVVHTGLWIGPANAHTRLHTDIDSYNLHAVLHGQKRFFMFAPSDRDYLYPSDVYEWATVFSQVDVRDPSTDRFPELVHATAFVGDVGPGDLIYIPIGWWHAVTCLQPTTSLNAWLFDRRLAWSRKLYRDLGKRVLHAAGLYARGRCTCHGNPDFLS